MYCSITINSLLLTPICRDVDYYLTAFSCVTKFSYIARQSSLWYSAWWIQLQNSLGSKKIKIPVLLLSIHIKQDFSTSAPLTFWAGWLSVVRAVRCTGGCLAASQLLPTRCQYHASPRPSCDNQKCFQALRDVPSGVNISPPAESHWAKEFQKNHKTSLHRANW